MTYLSSTLTSIDLPTLDGAIAKHLESHARRTADPAPLDHSIAGANSAYTSLAIIDSEQDLFAGRAEALYAYRLYAHGFETALALVAVTSRSPFNPDVEAIAALLSETRERIAETIAQERAQWELPA